MTARTPYRICMVCTGNICRSPMAEVVLRAMVEDAGLGDRVAVDSAGLSSWHVGDGADPRTVSALRQAGYDGTGHRARHFEPSWFAERDLVLAADRGHLRELQAMVGPVAPAGSPERLRLLREFDADADAAGRLELSDPYYGGARDFARCLREVEAACRGLVDHLEERLSS